MIAPREERTPPLTPQPGKWRPELGRDTRGNRRTGWRLQARPLPTPRCPLPPCPPGGRGARRQQSAARSQGDSHGQGSLSPKGRRSRGDPSQC